MALAEQAEALDKERLLCYKGNIWDQRIMAETTQLLQVQTGFFEEYINQNKGVKLFARMIDSAHEGAAGTHMNQSMLL